jgi:AAA15 family ATPase/GTPase
MQLYLDNFRSFKDQNFQFSKINILIGENSSGKSSILKFFLALKQSLQSFQNRSAINLTLQGDYVDLGNYEEMIYYHEIENKLSFSFTYGTDYPNFFKDYLELPDP